MLPEKDVAKKPEMVKVSSNSGSTCEWINDVTVFVLKVPKKKQNMKNIECLIRKQESTTSAKVKMKTKVAIKNIVILVIERMGNFVKKVRQKCCNKKNKKYMRSTLKLVHIKFQKLKKLLEKVDIKDEKVKEELKKLEVQIEWVLAKQ
jgi:hypothetical protein